MTRYRIVCGDEVPPDDSGRLHLDTAIVVMVVAALAVVAWKLAFEL